MMVNLRRVIKILRNKYMNEKDEMVGLEGYEYEHSDKPYEESKYQTGSSSFNDNQYDSMSSGRQFKKFNESEDYQGISGMMDKNRNNSPFSNNTRNARGSLYFEKEFFVDNQCSWPLNLMSLFHPFRLSDPLDMDLEDLFKLAIPFLDIRLGIQGVAESFTFIIAKNKPKKAKYKSLKQEQSDKFFNDMNWKISEYLTSTITTSMLSMLVSVIELKERDIAEIINNWLYILLIIMKVPKTKNLSLSYISKLLLKNEFNINSTARDVILRFFFYNMDINKEKTLIDEWSDLLMDTYRQLKTNNKYIKGSFADSSGMPNLGLNNLKDHSALTKYFGELEIRALIIISYYSLNYVQAIEPRISRR